MKKLFIIFFLLALVSYFAIKKLYHPILILIDTSGKNSKRGPGNFINGINQILPFCWNKCCFFSSFKNNFYVEPDLYFIPYPRFNEKQFDEFIIKGLVHKMILGPIFVPKKWNTFPNPKIWMERRFSQILELAKGVAVHSYRVRDYLAKRINTFKNLKKFKIVRPCSNFQPKIVNNFVQRKIDIIFFEKYADLNRRKQGSILLNLLKNTSKTVTSIKYGYYNKQDISEIANNSKFIIYFSFFDTGAIGLKEIQNYGVISFFHQKEFIIDKESSFYIPELSYKNSIEIAFKKIMNIIEKISRLNVQTQLIAKKNQMINKCENSLIDLCKSLF